MWLSSVEEPLLLVLATTQGRGGGHEATAGHSRAGAGHRDGAVVGGVQQQGDLLHAGLLLLGGVPGSGAEQLVGGEAAQAGDATGSGDRGRCGHWAGGRDALQQLILVVLGLIEDQILGLGHRNAVAHGGIALVVGRGDGAALEQRFDVLQVGQAVDLELVVQLAGNGDGLDVLVARDAVGRGDELHVLGNLVRGVDGHQLGLVLVARLQQDQGDGDDLLELEQDQLLDGHRAGEDASLGSGMGLGDQSALLELLPAVSGDMTGCWELNELN